MSIDLAAALDPVVMAEQAGVRADPWQTDLLRSTEAQTILLCSRQAGKSTVSSWLGLHQAIYVPRSLVLLLSPSQRQSGELFRKVKDAYTALGPAAPPVAEESALRLELANESRIISLPGKEATVRGFSAVSLLIVDEASRVPDELYQAVRPMLAVSGGRLILLSTPFGRRGFFFQEWDQGEAWKRVRITADQVPRIPKDWLEREREAIGDWWFRQEYGCEFVDTTDSVFAYEHVMAALSDDVRPMFEAKP